MGDVSFFRILIAGAILNPCASRRLFNNLNTHADLRLVVTFLWMSALAEIAGRGGLHLIDVLLFQASLADSIASSK